MTLRVFALGAMAVLSGCSATLSDCLRSPSALSTQGRDAVAELLPPGCRVVDTSSPGVAQLSCTDGRIGFVLNTGN
ncbi:hypothetical protein ANTHELSMS3_05046 (plasmid) [Antarctobacter heliothermus]|uniref:Lipoprotein n=1 Tax=Antarctobacter heliothermus TaxID=74033 RepID=A0A222EB54_9RHOB|nr:hypothetical protein ANTHELSMS3_05046 [Antarctobacter heliothermus]MBT52203.1 hypothetical protein [Mameliella sp.]